MRNDLMIAYACVEVDEQNLYWRFEDTERKSVKEEDMKAGKYIKGRQKVGVNNKVLYVIDYII